MLRVKGETKKVEEFWVDPRELYRELTRKAIITLNIELFWGANEINLDYVNDEIIVTYHEEKGVAEKRLTPQEIGVGLYDQVCNLLIGRDELLRIEKLIGE